MNARVTIGGDVCPIGRTEKYFVAGDAPGLFGELLEEFQESGLSIVNLECPLFSKAFPIAKRGPVLGATPDCVNGLIESRIDVISLANNHIMDHGPDGLSTTIAELSKAGMEIVGAGKDLSSARKVLVRQVKGVRVGILSVAESEFSIATEDSSGANPLNLIDFVRNIRSEKTNYDYLIVLLHGGNVNYPFPSPRLKNTCQFMIEMGANVVVVQHTHCPGSYESYRGGHIVYGQGNLIFDLPNQRDSFYKGFLIRLDISSDLTSSIHFIPYRQGRDILGARKLKQEAASEFLEDFWKRCRAITDDAFVKKQWLQHCERRKQEYLDKLLGHSKLVSKLNGNGRLLKYLYSPSALAAIQNVITCESHREVVETIFQNNMIFSHGQQLPRPLWKKKHG